MGTINKRALLEEADCIEVARYIGIDVVQRGANFFMLCPGHEARIGRPDTKIGSCVVYRNGYVCYACDPNHRHNVFDMVMEHLNCSFPQALEIVADIYGGKALYMTEGKPEKLPLSMEDLNLIGLKSSGNMFEPVNGSYQPIEVVDGYRVEHIDNEYLAVQAQHTTFSLILLKKENEAAFNRLIAIKAEEAMKKYEKALADFGTRQSPRASEVFDLFHENGGVKEEIFYGIQNTVKKKLWRCQEIYDAFKK